MQKLDNFLASIEQRAFRMAQLATHNEADALDIVQEAMMTLVKSYSDRDEQEWRPLFFTILQSRITDWARKESRRKRWFFWQSKDAFDDSNQAGEQMPETTGCEGSQNPLEQLKAEQLGDHLLAAIENLSLQQQQCFLLRSWEDLSVRETAKIMNINENSVKTHYFRAIQKLKQARDTYGDANAK